MRIAAIILSAIAALCYWYGYALGIAGRIDGTLAALLGGAILAPPVLILLSPLGPILNRFAAAMLALVPVVVIGLFIHFVPAGEVIYTTFGAWPFFATAVSAALALLALARHEDRAGPTGPMFPLGAAFLLAGLSVGTYLGRSVALFTETPVHAALALLACVIFAGIVLAFLSQELPRGSERFLRALIGLLPLLGFTGTILGIMQALGGLPALFSESTDPAALGTLLGGLSTAFETTLIGLVAALVAGFALILLTDALSRRAE